MNVSNFFLRSIVLVASMSLIQTSVNAAILADPTIEQFLDSVDAPEGTIAIYSGDPQSVGVSTTPLAHFPTKIDDTSFGILSSGTVSSITQPNSAENQGTDLGFAGSSGDTATVTLTIPVPSGAEAIGADFTFLSEEYPEFIGSQFNDFFSITLNGGTNIAVDTNGNPITVNNNFFKEGLIPEGTFFDGQTPPLSIRATIPDDASTITLEFSVGDVGDGNYDSAAFFNNIEFTFTPLGGSGQLPIIARPYIETQLLVHDLTGQLHNAQMDAQKGHLEILTSSGELTLLDPSTFNPTIFNTDNPTIVIVHGMRNLATMEEVLSPGAEVRQSILDIANQIQNRNDGDINVIVYNWEFESQGAVLDLADGQILNVPNEKTPFQGLNLARGLTSFFQMVEEQTPGGYEGKISFIGHSLGTNVAATAVELLPSPIKDNIVRLTLFDSPATAGPQAAFSDVSNAGSLSRIHTNLPQVLIDNYVSEYGIGYEDAVNIFIKEEGHSGILSQWYAQTVQPLLDIFENYVGTDNVGVESVGYSYTPGSSPLIFEIGSDYINNFSMSEDSDLHTYKPFDLFEDENDHYHEEKPISRIVYNAPIAYDALDSVGSLVDPVSTIIGTGFFNQNTGTLYGTTESPLVYEFVFDLGLNEEYLSFEFRSDNWDFYDAVFASINDELIFAQLGSYLTAGEWFSTGLINIVRFSGSDIRLNIGYLTDIPGTLFELRNIFTHFGRSDDVPEPSPFLFLIIMFPLILILKRSVGGDDLRSGS